jgi:glucokinase
MNPVAVLEIGGTHAIASWVELPDYAVRPAGRIEVRANAAADVLLDSFGQCVRSLGRLGGAVLSVAMPGPFDYAAGIGRFAGVGKFDALNGVDVRAGLAARLADAPTRITFLNDASAFGLGEWRIGAGRGAARVVVITLGTGIGSAFVDCGRLVTHGPDVPPEGHVYLLTVDGRPLESLVSRRAILARYRVGGGDARADVAEIAERAADGEPIAQDAFAGPLRLLGAVLAPWLRRFAAEVLVVGGGMSRSWSLVETALRGGFGDADPALADLPVCRASDPDAATAAGAAWHAVGDVDGPASGAAAQNGDERP